MGYLVHNQPPAATASRRIRIVPPRRTENLRRGGGRKSTPGWTEQKRKTNRKRFDQLRGFIQTAVTVIYPSCASSTQLEALNDCNRNFCKEKGIPARCVWEGPGYHQHIALGICHSQPLEKLWLARLRKQWKAVLGLEMGEKDFLWKPEIEPDKIASYLLKTRKDGGLCVKAAYAWLTFAPCWETGFRTLMAGGTTHALLPASSRKKKVNAILAESPDHPVFPRYTAKTGQTPEKEREICPVCGRRRFKSFGAGSCKCHHGFPLGRDAASHLLLAPPSCAGYSPPMSVATLQQFGQSLPSWLALVERGETVAIVDGGREVARLVPPEGANAKSALATAPVCWPDFAARRRALFGDVVLPSGTAQALVDEDRGA